MIINIGKDFSENPAGRTIELDGDDSGEAFRERHLRPSIRALVGDEKLDIILDDGVISYGSSFISSAFGKLVSDGDITANDILNKLRFVYDKDNKATNYYMERVEKRIVKSIEENSVK